ncbi:hypothetical protein BGW80DRAFT_450300 [Lactifluus volemus]|nr:hypothetical protein BGW80DRAFT_746088 [Lactifluus volemus]KAH9953903.1 hypothetical protein BGW80DRAFT_450300 [Lactifluus volemus]
MLKMIQSMLSFVSHDYDITTDIHDDAECQNLIIDDTLGKHFLADDITDGRLRTPQLPHLVVPHLAVHLTSSHLYPLRRLFLHRGTVCSPRRRALIGRRWVVLLTCQHDVVGVGCRNRSRSADPELTLWLDSRAKDPHTLADVVARWPVH